MIRKISATVLFVQNLDSCTAFYRDTLGLDILFSDDDSVGFRMECHDFLLLNLSAAHGR